MLVLTIVKQISITPHYDADIPKHSSKLPSNQSHPPPAARSGTPLARPRWQARGQPRCRRCPCGEGVLQVLSRGRWYSTETNGNIVRHRILYLVECFVRANGVRIGRWTTKHSKQSLLPNTICDVFEEGKRRRVLSDDALRPTAKQCATRGSHLRPCHAPGSKAPTPTRHPLTHAHKLPTATGSSWTTFSVSFTDLATTDSSVGVRWTFTISVWVCVVAKMVKRDWHGRTSGCGD